MKNHIIYIGIILCLLFAVSNQLHAQINTDQLQCNDPVAHYKIELEEGVHYCYKIKKGDTLESAKAKFRAQLLKKLSCNNFVCFDRNIFDCKPELIAVLEGDLTQSGNKYCSGNTIVISWKCGPCCRNTP